MGRHPDGQVPRAAVSAGGDVAEVAGDHGGDTVGFVVPAAAGGWLLGAGGGISPPGRRRDGRVLIDLAGEGGSRRTAAPG